MTGSVFDRLLLPIAEETDARTTAEAIEPYLESDADIVVVHVIEKTEGGPDKAPLDARREQAETIFEIAGDLLIDDDRSVRTELRYGSNVVDEILAAADEFDATAIGFTPRPGNRWVKLFSGDYAHRLTTETELPVLVFPHPEKRTTEIVEFADEPATEAADDTARRVLVPIDGSDPSRKALEHACSVYPDSEITTLHVSEATPPGVYDSMTGGPSTDFETGERRRKRAVARLFDDAKGIAAEREVELSTLLLDGNVSNAILTAAEETGADLIVMGRRGRTGIKQRLLGSTAESIIRRSSVPVTIVR